MTNQLINNAEALRLFFTDDVYLPGEEESHPETAPVVPDEIPKTAPIESVVPDAVPTAKMPDTPKTFSFKGGNAKHILILVNDNSYEVSNEAGTILLRNIVKSIGLAGTDFALVNYAAYSASTFDELKRFFNCTLMLAFGVEPGALGLPDYPLNAVSACQGIRVLFAKNLQELNEDIAAKKALWANLQHLTIEL